MVQLKRVYEPASRSDGRRFLVERLWPRGVKKLELEGVPWLKDVAPSPDLRKWYSHDVTRWAGFRRKYLTELEKAPAAWEPLLKAARRGRVTLLYSARDTEHNSALVLKQFLEERL